MTEPPNAPDEERRRQQIAKAARVLAEEKAERRDVGEGWIVNAARGIAAEHHDRLNAHLAAIPTASTSELVELMDATPLAAPSKPNGAVSTRDGVFLPGTGWCQRTDRAPAVQVSGALTNGEGQ